MCECGVDDPGITALAYCLSLGNTTLSALRLTKNKISDSGATELSKLLKSNTTLALTVSATYCVTTARLYAQQVIFLSFQFRV